MRDWNNFMGGMMVGLFIADRLAFNVVAALFTSNR